MKFAICQELFEGWDWERQCRFIAETGYTGIELAPFTLAPRITDVTDQQLDQLRRTAERYGLQIMGLHWLLAKTTGLHLTSADEAVRQATAEYLAALARACGRLGGTLMVFGSPNQRNLDDQTTREAGMERAASVLRAAVPAFREANVKLCLEPLTTRETNFLNTCDEAQELIDRVSDPHVTLHQDVKAMLGEGKPLPDLIRQYKGRVGHFHVNDTNLLGPGMGETDYHPIVAALLETGYDGWVSVEVFDYSPGAEKIAIDSLRYMQSVLQDLTA